MAAAVFALLSVVRHVPSVGATSCSNSTINGTYGGYGWGSQNGTLDNSVTIYTFNSSNGTFSESYWGMSGGTATSGSQSGDYSISSNCEGTLYNPSTYANYDHVSIVSSGAEIDVVNNGSGANISAVLKRQ